MAHFINENKEFLLIIKNEAILLGKIIYKLNNQLRPFKAFQHVTEAEKKCFKLIDSIENAKTANRKILTALMEDILVYLETLQNLGLELAALINMNYHLQFASMSMASISRIYMTFKAFHSNLEKIIFNFDSISKVQLKKIPQVIDLTQEGSKEIENIPVENLQISEKNSSLEILKEEKLDHSVEEINLEINTQESKMQGPIQTIAANQEEVIIQNTVSIMEDKGNIQVNHQKVNISQNSNVFENKKVETEINFKVVQEKKTPKIFSYADMKNDIQDLFKEELPNLAPESINTDQDEKRKNEKIDEEATQFKEIQQISNIDLEANNEKAEVIVEDSRVENEESNQDYTNNGVENLEATPENDFDYEDSKVLSILKKSEKKKLFWSKLNKLKRLTIMNASRKYKRVGKNKQNINQDKHQNI